MGKKRPAPKRPDLSEAGVAKTLYGKAPRKRR